MRQHPRSRPFNFRIRAGGWAPLLGLSLVLTGCGSDPAGSVVVADSTLGPVTATELEAYILRLPETRHGPEAGESLAEWRARLARELIVERAMVARAEAMLERPDLRRRLAEARVEVLQEAAEEALVDSGVRIEEPDLRAFYDRNPEEFGHPEQIRVRHIFRRVGRDAPDARREEVRLEMEALLTRLRNGAHFGDLARRVSDSETAHLDGLIGRLTRGALDPSLERIVWDLAEGELSPVVETPVGFHIFRVDDRVEAFRMSFEEARGRLRRRLVREAREEIEEEVFQALLEESGATYRPELLTSQGWRDDARTVFSLGDRVITLADVASYADGAPFLALRQTPPAGWLREAVWSALLVWKAETMGLGERSEVATRLSRTTERVKASFGARLALEEKLAEAPGGAAIQAYFDANYRRFQSPKRYRLRLVKVDFEGHDRAYDVFELLEARAEEIRSGRRDMAEVAGEISDDPSRERGGDIGWILLEALGSWAGPRAQNRVAEMEVGGLSDPLLVERYDQQRLTYRREGYMLIRVEDIQYPRVPVLEEVRDQVVRHFAEANRSRLDAEIMADTLERVEAVVFEEKL